MADATYIPKVYLPQGADKLVVANGGEIKLEPGAKMTSDGTQASHIADAAAAAGANPTKAEYDALVTKFNAVLAALENVGILAAS